MTYQLAQGGVARADGAFIPEDPANKDWQEYQVWLALGSTPEPITVPEHPVPPSVTPRQARLALLSAGLLDQVETAVSAAGGATKITWDYATTIERNSPLISTLGSSLGLTSEQIDVLFRYAATL